MRIRGRKALGAIVLGATAALIAVASVTAGGPPLPSTLTRKGADQQFVPGQVVVRFEPGVAKAAREAIVADARATIVENLLLPRTQLLRVPAGMSVASAVTEFKARFGLFTSPLRVAARPSPPEP